MSESRVIRPMDERDIPAACELIGHLGYSLSAEEMGGRLEWVRSSPFDWLYVCELDGWVCGLLGFRLRELIERPGRYGEISILVTHAEARRQGIGRALVEFAEQLARDHDCLGTWLVSGFGRKDDAHRFYERLGYRTTGYRFVKLFDEA